MCPVSDTCQRYATGVPIGWVAYRLPFAPSAMSTGSVCFIGILNKVTLTAAGVALSGWIIGSAVPGGSELTADDPQAAGAAAVTTSAAVRKTENRIVVSS